MNPDFWKGRRVFVTGHTGFKGSWLCLWLQQLGAEATGYALPPPTDPSLFKQARVEEGMRSVEGDVRDLAALRRTLNEVRPQVVIHMAAQSVVRVSYREPVDTFATNVMGTVNLLEAVRECASVRAVLIVTSDKCYENREWVWGYRESDPMGGHDPYSASKGCAELATAAYRRSFFEGEHGGRGPLGVATARAGNVVGGGDWSPDRLAPDFFRAALSGKPLVVRSPGSVRPWQHVLEPLGGYLELSERLWGDPGGFSEAWNFGPDDEAARPVSVVAEELVRLWGRGASWVSESVGGAPHEAGWLALDISKARQRLGWHPRMSLTQALRLTVEWYAAHAAGGDLRGCTEQQIRAYAAGARA